MLASDPGLSGLPSQHGCWERRLGEDDGGGPVILCLFVFPTFLGPICFLMPDLQSLLAEYLLNV